MANTSTQSSYEKWVSSMTSNWEVLTVLGALTLLWFTLRNLYPSRPKSRLPLPPGPRGWPLLGALPLMGRQPHITLRDMAKEYGPLMFMYWGWRPNLIATSPQMAREILKTHDQFTSGRPALEVVDYLFWGMKDFAFNTHGPRWRELRKLCTMHLFTNARVRQFESLRRKEMLRTLRRLLEESQQGKVVKVGRYLADMSTNNLTQMTWNKRHCGLVQTETESSSSFAAQEDEALTFQEVVREVTALVRSMNMGDLLPGIKTSRIQGLKKRMTAVRNRMDAFLGNLIEEHQKLMLSEPSGASKPDDKSESLLTLLLRESQDDESDIKGLLTMDTIKAVLLDILIVATDTTSSAMEWTIARLAKNPSLMKRLQDEITSVVGPDRLVEEEDVPKLKYLQAVIHETLRLHPPGPLGAMHMTMDDIEIAGYFVPKNTVIFVNWFAIQRSPDSYADPEEFRPERFLDPSAVEDRARSFEYNPFSAGRRACPGESLANALMHAAIANLVHAISWSRSDGGKLEDLDLKDDYVRHMKNPISLIAKPRLPHHVYKDVYAVT